MLITLFQKSQIKSLYILTAITLEYGNDVLTISEKLNMSQQAVRRHTDTLKEELAIISPNEPILIENNGQFILADTYKSNRFKPIIKLANTYLTDSRSANLLKLMIQQKKMNLLTLAHTLHISPSYCYTLIKQVNLGLKKYEIELVTQGNHVALKGEDIRLILLTYYFNKWQYELDDQLLTDFLTRHPEITSFNNIDESPIRLAIFEEALLSHGRPQKSSKHYDDHLDALYNIIQEGQDYFTHIPAPKTEAGDYLKRAVTAVTHLWITRVDSQTEQIAMANKMMALDNPISELSHNLISSFIYRFNLKYIQNDKNIYALIFFHLTINLMYIQQFRIDFSNLFYPSIDHVFKNTVDSDTDLTVEYKLIENFMKKVPIKSPIWDLASSPHFKKNIYRIFYATLNYASHSKVKIYVDMSASVDGLYLFKQKLSHLFSSDFFTFTESPLDADVVFIDRAKQIKTSGHVYLVFNMLTNQKWQDIFTYIMNIYFEKIDRLSDKSINDYFI